MTTVRTRVQRSALAGVIVFTGIALISCAQVPASELAATCVTPDNVQVERTASGSGPVVQSDGIAAFTFSAATEDGTDILPESTLETTTDGSPAPVNVNTLDDYGLSSVKNIMQCARSGDHITATMPVSEFFDETASSEQTQQLSGNVVVQVQVDRVYHSAATGSIRPQQNGLPAVVTAPDGTPGVTMPNEAAPAELRSGTTIAGNGPTVAAGDLVTLHFSAFAWSSGTELGATWGSSPFQTVVGNENDGLFGATAELQGISVGSQKVVVLPASLIEQLTTTGSPVGNGDAVVVVIDVLGVDQVAQ